MISILGECGLRVAKDLLAATAGLERIYQFQ